MHETQSKLGSRLRMQWRMKLWLGAALLLFVCCGYFAAQHMPLRAPTTLRTSLIDRLIPFSPGWTWAYLSLYLLLGSAWLATTREQLWRYAAGMTAMCMVAFAIFFSWPVAGPRPAQPPDHAVYRLLVRYDGPLNTFPSLHVALAVYAARFGSHVLERSSSVALLLWIWAAVICWSTMPTKQHYFCLLYTSPSPRDRG